MSDAKSHVDRVDRHRYEFRSVWLVECQPAEVFETLSRLGEYARWWPQVRRSERDDAGNGLIYLRSALPFTLRMDMKRQVEDPSRGVLRAGVSGDLDGFVEWHVHQSDAGARVDFCQVVSLTHPFVRRVDRWIRPILSWNHAVAMAGGASGLRRSLETGPRSSW